MKKTLSLVLSLVMLLSVTAGLSFNAYAGTINTVTITVPDNLVPTTGSNVSAYDLTTITWSRSGDGLINTASCSSNYQVKGTSSWSNVTSGTFEAGKVYRIKVRIDAGGNNDSFDTTGTGLTCTLNTKAISGRDSDNADTTDNYYNINEPTHRYLSAFLYIGMMTQKVSSLTITNAPEADLGTKIEAPVGLKIDDHFSITNPVDVQKKDGDKWVSAVGENYECDTQYRLVAGIKTDDGYIIQNNVSVAVKTSVANRTADEKDISKDGKTGTIYCKFPNAPKKHVVDATDTVYWPADDATCTVTGKCKNCGKEISETAKATKTIIKDAKCEEDGEVLCTAKFEGGFADETVTVPLEALGHDFGKGAMAEYEVSWSETNACTCKGTCKRCGKEVTETVEKPDTDVAKAPTCTEWGETKYIARFTKGFDDETEILEDIEPLGHTFKKGVCTVCGTKQYTLTFGKLKKIKKSAKKTVIKVTLKKNGKILKKKKVTLKIAGKKFTVKTNKKGVATFTIKKAALKKLKAGKKAKLIATYGKFGKAVKKVKVVK